MIKVTLACVSLPFLLAALPRFDRPAFGVAEGTRLEKTFRTSGALVLEDTELRLNGEDADLDQFGMPTDLELQFAYELECADTYESVAERRPLVLLRSFEKMLFRGEGPDGSEEDEPLEVSGKTVRFEWDAESEGYKRSFVGDEGGDEEDLDNLSEDLDLRRFLPAGDVEEGDTWSVEGLATIELLMPAVDVRRKIEAGDFGEMPEGLVDVLKSVIEDLAVECTYLGTVEEDGVTLGQIGMHVEASQSHAVDTSFLSEDPDAPEFTWDHFDAQLELDFDGTLLWDLAGGRFVSVEGSGEGSLGLDFSFEIVDFGLAAEGTLEFSLELEHEASAR